MAQNQQLQPESGVMLQWLYRVGLNQTGLNYRSRVCGFLALVILSMLLAACNSYQFKGTEYPDPPPATDFELSDTRGGTFRLHDQLGRVVLLFFGYTHCPDICPTTLAEAKQVIKGLGEDAAEVRFLFITVDPERDTAAVLREYVAFFHPDIIGLTGDVDSLEAMRKAYGIYAERVDLPESTAGYVMDHSARVFLIDPEGRLRLSYAYGTSPDDLVQDIRYLLK